MLSNWVVSIDLSVLAVESFYWKMTRERLGENTALQQHGVCKMLTNRLDRSIRVSSRIVSPEVSSREI